MKLGIRQPLLISGDLLAHWQTGWTAVEWRAAETSLLDGRGLKHWLLFLTKTQGRQQLSQVECWLLLPRLIALLGN